MNESPVFPCGRIARNRLVKAAMYEAMANFGGGPPAEEHLRLYSEWASGGWGMVITGNVQVSRHHLTLGRDIVLPENSAKLDRFRGIANSFGSKSSDDSKSILIMQLSHAGRQSPRFIGGRHPWIHPLAASSNSMSPNESMLARIVFSLLFQSPRAMSIDDINSVILDFLRGAKVAHQTGFDGIQLHASHGYLLSQFLSTKNNRRTDSYGPPNELRLLREIVEAIRSDSSIPTSFVVGIKLNAGDYARDRLSGDKALSHVRAIAEWGNVDFLEISGGDYESPDFLAKDNPRQAFFAEFSRKAVECVSQVEGRRPLVMLTGSLRSLDTIRNCLAQRHADLIGIGRPAILYPDLPHRLIHEKVFPAVPNTPALSPWLASLLQVKLVGAGLDTAMWVRAMKRLTRGDGRKLDGNAVDAFFHLFFNATSIMSYVGLVLVIVGVTMGTLGHYMLY